MASDPTKKPKVTDMRYILLVAGLLVHTSCYCQFIGTVGAISQGTVVIKTAGKTVMAKPGTQVFATDTLCIPVAASVTISCSLEQPVLINKQNIKAINRLSKTYHTDTVAITRQGMIVYCVMLAEYCRQASQNGALLNILVDIGKEMVDNSGAGDANTGGTYAATTRGGPCYDTARQAFDTLVYSSGSLELLLRHGQTPNVLAINIYSDIATTDTVRSLKVVQNRFDLAVLGTLSAGNYYWALENPGEECTRHVLTVLDKAACDTLKLNYHRAAQLLTDDTAEQAYLAGSWSAAICWQKHLTITDRRQQ
jgi:hypothetical protein